MVCIFDFCNNMNPHPYILFLVDKSMTKIMNICFENCYKLVICSDHFSSFINYSYNERMLNTVYDVRFIF